MNLTRLASATLASMLLAALPLGLLLILGGCLTAAAVPDPETARLARAVGSDAQQLRDSLAGVAAPDCDIDHAAPLYDNLDRDADALVYRAATLSLPLRRASTALQGTVRAARESHRLATLDAGDRHGPCLAPEALDLNVAAIIRASTAIETAASAGLSGQIGEKQ